MRNDKLYNIFRPTTFKDVVGQDLVVSSLKALIKNESWKILKNFIFHSKIGGVGKTLLARILAKAINCENHKDGEPCGECKSCIRFDKNQYTDYIELDGASYNSVNDVKNIMSLANQMPANKNKHRIIVIDEFHRISVEGQDTLLKFLEEANNSNIFIFATTNYSKISNTIRTRCFNFEIKPVKISEVKKKLVQICEKENIPYSDDSLSKLASISDGSLRESIKLAELSYRCYGDLISINLEHKFDQIVDLFYNSLIGNIDDLYEDTMQLQSNDINKDLAKVIYDLHLINMGKEPKFITPPDKFKMQVISSMLPNFTDSFLKYNVSTVQSLALFLASFGRNISENKQSRKNKPFQRRFVGVKNVNPLEMLKKYNFMEIK